MPIEKHCLCGTLLRAPQGFETGRALCPVCHRVVTFGESAAPKAASGQAREPQPVVDFLDPPPPPPAASPPARPQPPWGQRMLAALLDPRSIQWMMMLGGG